MACPSLIALPRVCGTQGVVAGMDKLYLISFADLGPVDSETSDAIFTLASGGMINAIGLAEGKTFVEVGLLKASASLDQSLTKDSSKGTSFMTHTLKFVLSDFSIENQAFVQSILNQPVAALAKYRSGNYYAVGLNGKFELSALDGGSGTAEADLVGYTLTLSGTDSSLITLVDPTIVAGLI